MLCSPGKKTGRCKRRGAGSMKSRDNWTVITVKKPGRRRTIQEGRWRAVDDVTRCQIDVQAVDSREEPQTTITSPTSSVVRLVQLSEQTKSAVKQSRDWQAPRLGERKLQIQQILSSGGKAPAPRQKYAMTWKKSESIHDPVKQMPLVLHLRRMVDVGSQECQKPACSRASNQQNAARLNDLDSPLVQRIVAAEDAAIAEYRQHVRLEGKCQKAGNEEDPAGRPPSRQDSHALPVLQGRQRIHPAAKNNW